MKYYYRVYGLNIESTIEVEELETIDSCLLYTSDAADEEFAV